VVNNKFAKTMIVEAKYSLVSKQYPIDLSKEEIERLNYDTFKIALKVDVENLKLDDEEKYQY